jgi:alpha-amylase/alpha-mannosidase (GH57 family)
MHDDQPLEVVLCWHMHQPQYCDLSTGEYHLPWTYLHAIKDYVDMAAHLENHPGMRAVVNFAPILLEQLDDYSEQLKLYLRGGKQVRDPLLAALDNPVMPRDCEQCLPLIRACLRANRERLIDRYPAYRKLAEMAEWVTVHQDMATYVDDQFVSDLLVWYHLAWLGESVRRRDERIQRLMNKGRCFSLSERRQLVKIIFELVSSVIPRYRKLAERGQVELSVTPYAHPILPLLLDLGAAREAMPDVNLPRAPAYPGGEERARLHIERAIEVFERYFGFRPQGCWPAEGGVSTATLELLQQYGFRWTASGEGVLRNSLARSAELHTPAESGSVHCPYRLPDQTISCFFRDDGLSDLIGFSYSNWHADDAVADFIHHLENIHGACGGGSHAKVVTIILDGENAWEYYPENGWYFLDALYRALTKHPNLKLTTFSDTVAAVETVTRLPAMVSGSWVYGTFSTWIGDDDKNRGWDMLVDTKKAFDQAVAENRLDVHTLAAAEEQLSICEGSDWFWWFGDYNPADTVSDFDLIYRRHLSNLYRLLAIEPPDYLAHAFTHGGGSPEMGGTMRAGGRGSE